MMSPDLRTRLTRPRSLAAVALLALGLFSRFAGADEDRCFPKCRKGFVCGNEGKCVSECNPSCASGEVCRGGECALESSVSSPPRAPKPLEIWWLGGLGAHVSSASAPVLLTSFSVVYGGTHALVAGAQGGIAFFNTFLGGATVGEFGLNVGYRGMFTTGEVGAGILALVQPQIWIAGDALLGLGGAVGGVITYKRLVVEVPLSVSRVARFENHLETSDKAIVFTPSVLAGISF